MNAFPIQALAFGRIITGLFLVLPLLFGSCNDKEDPELGKILDCPYVYSMKDLPWLQEIIRTEESYQPRSPMRIWLGDFQGKGVIVHETPVSSCYLCAVYDCNGNIAFETSLKDVDRIAFYQGVKNIKTLYSYKWFE